MAHLVQEFKNHFFAEDTHVAYFHPDFSSESSVCVSNCVCSMSSVDVLTPRVPNRSFGLPCVKHFHQHPLSLSWWQPHVPNFLGKNCQVPSVLSLAGRPRVRLSCLQNRPSVWFCPSPTCVTQAAIPDPIFPSVVCCQHNKQGRLLVFKSSVRYLLHWRWHIRVSPSLKPSLKSPSKCFSSSPGTHPQHPLVLGSQLWGLHPTRSAPGTRGPDGM